MSNQGCSSRARITLESAPIAAHITQLREQGYRVIDIARASRTDRHVLERILYSNVKRVRRATAERIYSVRAGEPEPTPVAPPPVRSFSVTGYSGPVDQLFAREQALIPEEDGDGGSPALLGDPSGGDWL